MQFGANIIESKKHQTIWSDGLNILYNKEYVEDKANDAYIEGEMLHCVLHCAFLHASRKKYRDNELWNKACDYPVNAVVSNYFPLFPDALTNATLAAKSPEAIYEILREKEQKKEDKKPGGKGKKQKGDKQDGSGQGDQDDQEDGNEDGEGQPKEQPGTMYDADPEDGDGDGQDQDENERQWRRALTSALEKSPPGSVPGNLQRLITDIFPKEKIDWKDLIRDMSRDAKSKTTRTWHRPNRRRLGGGEYMPGYGNDQVFKLVMCLDVSGSVSQQMIQEMCDEAASLLDQDLVTNITLVSVDTKIQSVLEAASSEDIKGWNAKGGGGTDFRTAMATVGQMTDVIGCIFLTDMQTSSFGEQPEFPVVWVDWTNGGAKAPYGRTVPYK
jgi:predicted metal-dependent peptidase